jgi:hypothetical protein
MSIFNFNEIKNYKTSYRSYDEMKVNNQFINESNININTSKEYEIFLSHSYADREIIPHLKQVLEDMGYRVYVDWIDDKLLSRENVTKETAKILQIRMKQSKSLFFATSENSPSSKWMPWELGYFDALKNKRVAILPIQKENNGLSNNFIGQEYLGLYYYVTLDSADKSVLGKVYAMEKNAFDNFVGSLKKQITLYINKTSDSFIHFDEWLGGEEPLNEEQKLVMNFFNIKEKLNE